eukprot:gene2006-2614_t
MGVNMLLNGQAALSQPTLPPPRPSQLATVYSMINSALNPTAEPATPEPVVASKNVSLYINQFEQMKQATPTLAVQRTRSIGSKQFAEMKSGADSKAAQLFPPTPPPKNASNSNYSNRSQEKHQSSVDMFEDDYSDAKQGGGDDFEDDEDGYSESLQGLLPLDSHAHAKTPQRGSEPVAKDIHNFDDGIIGETVPVHAVPATTVRQPQFVSAPRVTTVYDPTKVRPAVAAPSATSTNVAPVVQTSTTSGTNIQVTVTPQSLDSTGRVVAIVGGEFIGTSKGAMNLMSNTVNMQTLSQMKVFNIGATLKIRRDLNETISD